jgi:hypothetical protein
MTATHADGAHSNPTPRGRRDFAHPTSPALVAPRSRNAEGGQLPDSLGLGGSSALSRRMWVEAPPLASCDMSEEGRLLNDFVTRVRGPDPE